MRPSLHAVPGAHGHKDGAQGVSTVLGSRRGGVGAGRAEAPPPHTFSILEGRVDLRGHPSPVGGPARHGAVHAAGAGLEAPVVPASEEVDLVFLGAPHQGRVDRGSLQAQLREGRGTQDRLLAIVHPVLSSCWRNGGVGGACAAAGLPSGHVPPPTPPRTFPASVSLSIKHKRPVITPAWHPYPQGHWAMPAAPGGTGGKGRSEQRRGHLGACSLPALGCSPRCQPSRSRPCPWRAPGSHLWHSELTSLPTFSKLCPHAGHFTTSAPQSLVSRPGARITRASRGAIPSNLLQPREPPPPGSLPAVPKGVSHAFPGPQDSGAPSICPSAHPVCLSLPLAMMFLAPSSLLSVTWPTHLGRTRCGPGHPQRPRPQGWAAPASGERPAQGSRAAAGPHAAATQSLP